MTLRFIPISIAVLSSIILYFMIGEPSLLKQVKNDGEIVVAMRKSPTTYYEGADGPTGFEYDLASQFAEYLGVKLKIVEPLNLSELFQAVQNSDVHFAAAGLTVTEPRKQWVRFTTPYQEVTQQLVYQSDMIKPRSAKDLPGFHIEVVADSSHVERLREIKKTVPDLEWEENNEISSDELLYMVAEQLVDYTVADSNEFVLNQRFYPELRVAFNLTKPQKIAWAFPKGTDDSLFNEALRFLKKIKKNGELDGLIERYYGHVSKFDYVGTRIYERHIQTKLPKFQEMFQQAAEKYNIDWKLLAAIGYQESNWNSRARSPTGVRGIMMLTQNTARFLKIKNRMDPKQSIFGGARYFSNLVKRIPQQIKEPERIWMALAAYNIGLGHLEDARVITESRGGNPDLWNDVKDNLPLLAQKKWYKKTKHGYARGWEPVSYVENIRRYYEALVFFIEQAEGPKEEPNALSVDSPTL